MPVSRTYFNNIWSANPNPVVPPPTPAPTPAPSVPIPTDSGDWWRTRGGHQLYDLFDQIYKANPMAGRAFWESVVGRGQGQNDLMAATIHKMFGGDMNAYNNWRNQYHSLGLDAYAGYFDLNTGTWTPGAGFNPQYVKDKTGWDVSGPWKYNGNWNDLKNQFQPGLQSTPGNAYAGADSWKTYLAGVSFGPNGTTYPGVAQQAAIANNTGTPVPKMPVKPGGQPMPNPAIPGLTPAAAPPGSMASPPPSTPATPNVSVPTTTYSPDPTTVNPNAQGKPQGKSYQFPVGRWWRN